MMRRYLISTLLTLSTTIATAQLSLQEYVDMVVDYSHTIARAETKVDGADAEYRIAKRGVLPTVSLSSDAPDMNIGVDILQPIYNGGRNKALEQQREWGVIEAEKGLERSLLDVRYEAEVAYWSLSRAEMYHWAMCNYITIIEALKSVAQHRFDEGYTSKSDLLQVESRLSDAEYLLSEAEQQWSVALHRFNILRGESASASVLLGDGIFDSVAMPKREDIAYVIEHHPDYLRAVAGMESAQYGIDLRRAEYLPSVNAGIFGRWQPTDNGRAKGGIMVSLNTPIFHFMERRDAIRSAKSSYTSAQLQIAEVVDEIVLNESSGWANLEYTHRRVEAVQRNLDIAQENLDISTYSYNEGVATILDVLQAQISWLQIYENAIAAEYDYAVAIASYRYIVAR
jgi:outer membrane protein TolC